MKKLVLSLTTALLMVLGGTVLIAPSASADEWDGLVYTSSACGVVDFVNNNPTKMAFVEYFANGLDGGRTEYRNIYPGESATISDPGKEVMYLIIDLDRNSTTVNFTTACGDVYAGVTWTAPSCGTVDVVNNSAARMRVIVLEGNVVKEEYYLDIGAGQRLSKPGSRQVSFTLLPNPDNGVARKDVTVTTPCPEPGYIETRWAGCQFVLDNPGDSAVTVKATYVDEFGSYVLLAPTSVPGGASHPVTHKWRASSNGRIDWTYVSGGSGGGHHFVPDACKSTATAQPVALKSVTVKVTKKPTSKKAGKATITLVSSTSTKVSGKGTLVLKKGTSTKKVAFTVKNGKASIKLPKLKKGTWKLQAKFTANTTFKAKNSKTVKVKVVK